jgi:CBS domain-containing protein
MRAREMMSTPVVTVRPETPLKAVAEAMAAHRVSGVPVVDGDGRLVGIVAESDFLAKMEDGPRRGFRGWLARILRPGRVPAPRTARDLMTTPVITAGPDATVRELARLMAAHDVNRIPIVEDGRVVGIVTRADILRTLARPDPAITEEVRWRLATDLWIDTSRIDVATRDGIVTIAGTVDTRTEAQLVARWAAATDGVVGVDVSRLRYRFDDQRVKVTTDRLS